MLQLHEAKARLSELINAVMKGEEVVISRYGKPVAKLVGLSDPKERELGFYPIHFQSDLIRTPHTRLAGQFKVEHKDPFDRLLAAQAFLEKVAFISKDKVFDPFPMTRVW